MFVPLLWKDKGCLLVRKTSLPGQLFSHFGTSMFSSNMVHRLLLRTLCWPFLGST